jgi:hypothetical protein
MHRRLFADLASLTVLAIVGCGTDPAPQPMNTAGNTGTSGAGVGGQTGGGATGLGGTSGGLPGTAGTAGSGTAGTTGGGTGGGGGDTPPACKPVTGVNGSGLTVSAPDISAFKYVPKPDDIKNTTKLAYDPVGKVVVMLLQNGTMFSFDPNVALPTAAMNQPVTTYMPYNAGYTGNGDHRGIVFDKDGHLYVMSAQGNAGQPMSVTIKKGTLGAGGARTWTDLVTTGTPYTAGTAPNYNHSFSGLTLSPDGKSLLFSSGSRTEHGEEQGPSGIPDNNRESPLTSAILKVPTDTPTVLHNNDAMLQPFLFADGTRNAFSIAFNAAGDLIGTDNGPDMDLPDELNFIEQGKHYGFPWRFGDVDNPVRMAGFVRENDKRLRADVYQTGAPTYKAEPNFPAPPAGGFVDPIRNLGPDANFFVASATAAAPTKADAVTGLMGITAHRSPLGLVFDAAGASCGEYYKQGFFLSYGPIPSGSIGDAGQDLVLVTLKKADGKYTMNAKQIAKGILGAIDAVMVGNRLFTIGYGDGGNVFVFALPTP